MLIVLDTVVISESISPAPDPTVSDWLSQQSRSDLRLTTVTVGELLYGVADMVESRARRRIMRAIHYVIDVSFEGLILNFDQRSAEHYADIRAHRKRIGHQIAHADCQIAATARSVGAAVATRNTRDFENSGIEVINPWDYSP